MMLPFVYHRGLVVALDRANVDTDQIIPKQFLKSIRRSGFGSHLFHDWRCLPDGRPDPGFILNEDRFRNASILVTRSNFGCGSSREHAVWALQEYGFKVIVASSQLLGQTRISAFADIFRTNSTKNGLLTIELSEPEVEEIIQMVSRYRNLEATVDLPSQRFTLHLAEEISFHFDIDPASKDHLVQGLDPIARTLQYEAAIRAFEDRHDVQWQ